jgi:uncharacterized ferritin-like protein (DUF455 family)
MRSQKTGKMEEHVRQLQHFQSYEIQVSRLLGGWLPGISRWEVKHQVGAHLWEDAQHSREIRTRLWELRTANPDRGVAETVLPVVNLLAAAQHDYELLAGIYLALKAELISSYREYLDSTYIVYDSPTIPMLRKIVAEEEDQLAWAKQTIAELAGSGEAVRNVGRWTVFARAVLEAAGGIGGRTRTDATDLPEPPPAYTCLLPFPEAKRDERFDVRLDASPMPDSDDRLAQVLFQFSNYTMEMQAAETLGSILWEVKGMPWEFYYDLARHCADEVRHSKLGETRLMELGYHTTEFPHSVGNYAWRQLIDPLRRYCALTEVIEAGGFEYKHATYRRHVEHGDHESAQAVLFDIIDETMHVRFGHKWVPRLMEHYHYSHSNEDLVEECRRITEQNSFVPLQRESAARMAARHNADSTDEPRTASDYPPGKNAGA